MKFIDWLKSLFSKKPEAPAAPAPVPAPAPAPVAPKPVDFVSALIAEAKKHIGEVERGGNNRGPEVEKYLAYLGIKPGVAWCMAFVQYCVGTTCKNLGIKQKLPRSGGCVDTWDKSPKEIRLSSPEVGSIVIWKHKNSVYGHTGIVIAVNGKTFTTIEGNTGPGMGIVREGDGVYQKERKIGGDGDMVVVGFIRCV